MAFKVNGKTGIKWNGEKVNRNIKLGMEQRVKLAAQLLRDRVVRNISRPVTKMGTQRNKDGQATGNPKVDPASRSKPGEYPKAETTRLMKDIFWQMDSGLLGNHSAIVGTTLDYGAILELSKRLDRSYLRRTFNEQLGMIRKILLAGPPLPGQTKSFSSTG